MSLSSPQRQFVGDRPSPGRSATLAVDAAVAFCWIPFSAIGWALREDPTTTARFVAFTLLVSFAHQPLTLALVYGDRETFDLRRRIFMWSPLVLATAIAVTQSVSLITLALVAGLWNV
jgi:hypothetical protein